MATIEVPHKIRALVDHHITSANTPLYIAIDGHSGSGKSTIARSIAAHYGSHNVTVIEGDDFYSGGSAAHWDNRTAAQNAQAAIDRDHLFAVLQTLMKERNAQWHAFNWYSEQWDAATAPRHTTPTRVVENRINIVEGVYTTATPLAALYQLRIMINASQVVRRQRVALRDGEHFCPRWHERWLAAENAYFGSQDNTVFDLLIP